MQPAFDVNQRYEYIFLNHTNLECYASVISFFLNIRLMLFR